MIKIQYVNDGLVKVNASSMLLSISDEVISIADLHYETFMLFVVSINNHVLLVHKTIMPKCHMTNENLFMLRFMLLDIPFFIDNGLETV